MELDLLMRRLTRVTAPVMSNWLHQLSMLQKAGIELVRSLEILEQQEPNPRLRYVTRQLRYGLWNQGSSLSELCISYPAVFSPTVVLMVESGEETGDLCGRLEQAAKMLDSQHSFTSRVRQAVTTPLVTLVVSLLLVFTVVRTILPRFLDMFITLHAQLPLITRMVIGVVHVTSNPAFFLGPFAAIVFVWLYLDFVKEAGQIALLTWPGTRRLMGQILALRFCDTLGRLQQDGIPLAQGIDLLYRTTTFHYHADTLDAVKRRFLADGDLVGAVERIPYFPPVVAEMMAVGLETGRLGYMLMMVARLLDEDTQELMARVVALIEPLSLFLVGGIMLFFILGVFVPMYQLLNSIH